ncbi:excisionase family DNA-binding protein [Desulfocurvus sp. DL9XJH121]
MDTNKGRKLNCSKSYFYNLINEGKIPAFRCGKVRGIWVWEEDVRGYLEVVSF